MIRKTDYINTVVPATQQFKFNVWGHDSVILHEHDVRKQKGPFAFLRTDPALRTRFFNDLNALIDATPMKIFASVIDKRRLKSKYAHPLNPYNIALRFCMERLHEMLTNEQQHGRTVHVVFESRGSKEDRKLEFEFHQIVQNKESWGYIDYDFNDFDFQSVFMPKASNSTGLSLALSAGSMEDLIILGTMV